MSRACQRRTGSGQYKQPHRMPHGFSRFQMGLGWVKASNHSQAALLTCSTGAPEGTAHLWAVCGCLTARRWATHSMPPPRWLSAYALAGVRLALQSARSPTTRSQSDTPRFHLAQSPYFEYLDPCAFNMDQHQLSAAELRTTNPIMHPCCSRLARNVRCRARTHTKGGQ